MLRNVIEASPIFAWYGLCKVLPKNVASNLGGWLGRCIGRWLPVHRIGHQNLDLVMPDLTYKQRHRLLQKVWDNLGRLAAEMPHIAGMTVSSDIQAKPDILIRGEHVFQKILDDREPVILCSGHYGNWEVLMHVGRHYGIDSRYVYRPANNPLVDHIITHVRGGKHLGIPKGGSIKDMLGAIRQRQNIAFLIDQKFRDGQPVTFMNQPVKTATTPFEISFKYNLTIIPMVCFRENGQLVVQMEDGFKAAELANSKQDAILKGSAQMYQIFEKWIRHSPESWLWLHKRWDR